MVISHKNIFQGSYSKRLSIIFLLFIIPFLAISCASGPQTKEIFDVKRDEEAIQSMAKKIVESCHSRDLIPIIILQSDPESPINPYKRVDDATGELRIILQSYMTVAYKELLKKKGEQIIESDVVPYVEGNAQILDNLKSSPATLPGLPCTALPKSRGLLHLRKVGNHTQLIVKIIKLPEPINRAEDEFPPVTLLSKTYNPEERPNSDRPDNVCIGYTKDSPAPDYQAVGSLIGIAILCRLKSLETKDLQIDISWDNKLSSHVGENVSNYMSLVIEKYVKKKATTVIGPSTFMHYKNRYAGQSVVDPNKINATIFIQPGVSDDGLLNLIIRLYELKETNRGTVSMAPIHGLPDDYWVRSLPQPQPQSAPPKKPEAKIEWQKEPRTEMVKVQPVRKKKTKKSDIVWGYEYATKINHEKIEEYLLTLKTKTNIDWFLPTVKNLQSIKATFIKNNMNKYGNGYFVRYPALDGATMHVLVFDKETLSETVYNSIGTSAIIPVKQK